MPAHVALQPAPAAPGSGLVAVVVCAQHALRRSFGAAHDVAQAACAEHNRLHHPDPTTRPALLSIVYTSVAARDFTAARVEAMLTKARVHNRAVGITGMLLRERGRFLQALEGPERAVDELMRTIEHDARHGRVRVLVREDREERRFPDWAMASGHVAQVEALPLSEYFEALLMARGEDPADARPHR